MSKRLRARVNLGRDKQGKPVYKWASAYSQEELDAEIARIHQEYDRAHHRRKPAKASASPVEPSRVPNDQIPVPDIGASPSPLSAPSCPTPGADSRRRKGKTPVSIMQFCTPVASLKSWAMKWCIFPLIILAQLRNLI